MQMADPGRNLLSLRTEHRNDLHDITASMRDVRFTSEELNSVVRV
jgi:hypothetical protein